MIEPTYQDDEVTLYLADCLDVLPQLEAGSVDAVVTDVPYYEITNNDWDRQWKNRSEYIEWIGALASEWERVTVDNGSIFIFCDEMMEAYVQVELDKLFQLINKIVWFKRNNLPIKNAHLLRSFAPVTERALFYGKHNNGVQNFATLIKQAREQKGLSAKQVAELGGFYGNVNHGGIVSNWESGYSIPSFDQWEQLVTILGIYAKEYGALCRPFNADAKTLDVIEYPVVNGKDNTEHPTTKPSRLMRRITSVITNANQIVLDCCMGSGTTGVACAQLGRRFVGIEIDEKYFSIAVKRIKQARLQLRLGI